jgi:hypothetical protein
MRLHRITLLVVIYITLDFANPLMPGTVQFLDGSLEADAGCYSRRVKDPAPATASLPRPLLTVALARKPALPVGQVISASPPKPFAFRAPVLSRSTPASSPDDD